MPDHHHTDVTDPDASVVPFKQQLHSFGVRTLDFRQYSKMNWQKTTFMPPSGRTP
ncbi:hypothetical protein ENSA7_21310 [Enhygromyxa salina]|uniref:Uncharacterized protein n=1 Tax=Enhygromyxa salina TaxID=215803 RepID=A0A2S9YSY7_9BACT|nr:hypothetical protein ENSA7_21310 [Enhygromyxa salina]